MYFALSLSLTYILVDVVAPILIQLQIELISPSSHFFFNYIHAKVYLA